jgi:predicted secreted protein
MDIFGAIVTYVVIWVIVLFMILPIGVRQPEEQETGHMPGAPENPRLWLKFAATSAIAAVLWGLAYFAFQTGLIALPSVPN